MSLNNFIPELWSANIMSTLDKAHIFAQLANNDYEGDISGAGDTVRINQIGDVTISTYTKDTNISAVETFDDAQTVLKIDQQKWSVRVFYEAFTCRQDGFDRCKRYP